MNTDSERREVAQKLRAMVSARSYEVPGGRGSLVDIDDLLTELLGRRVYDSEESVDSFEAMYVADLIDRGECENVYDESECGACDNGFECSVCGCRVEDEEHYHVSGEWNFCPQCGRRVRHG